MNGILEGSWDLAATHDWLVNLLVVPPTGLLWLTPNISVVTKSHEPPSRVWRLLSQALGLNQTFL